MMTMTAFRKLGCRILLSLAALINTASAEEVKGLIISCDNEGMYVRNEDGQFEVTWTAETKVALMVNTRLLKGLSGNQFEYPIHSSKEVVMFPVPAGPITGIKISRGGKQLVKALKEASEENWIVEHGLSLYFGEKPGREQMATADDPRFIGVWDPTTKPRTLSIKGQKYEISLKKGGQTTIPLFGILTVKDLNPFVNKAMVIGKRHGDIIIAEEIRMQPIGNQAGNDDPDLPRYLFIGDSISGNYGKALRGALEDRFNLHHPPTNCGPSANGAKNIVNWLGAFDQPGRHWDVVSFNHGHWDSGNDKASYQASLELVITELKKTGAKLIWVTTCPVPNGYETAGALNDRGKAPGRTAGVMEKYLNPWAAEVVERHPEISVCDQWQFVKANEGGLYTDWWAGKNVHFKGKPSVAIGRFLAEHVLQLQGIQGPRLNAQPKPKSKPPRSVRKPSAPAKPAAGLIPRKGIPLYKPDFPYTGKKAYGLYPEKEAATALVDEWKSLKRLAPGFPKAVSDALVPAGNIPDGSGGTFDIARPPSQEVLARLKTDFQKGVGLAWYFLPRVERYRKGPGLTGDELLEDLKSGKFPEDSVHVSFIYGFYTQNVTLYYWLYRASGDPYYVDQIVKYAEGVEWLLENRPQQLIPAARRDQPLENPVAEIPHEPAAMANFWAHVNAARLLLERASAEDASADDPRVRKAKQFLDSVVNCTASQITADYKELALKRGQTPQRFEAGVRTLEIREKFGIPARAAQTIEYTPWNQTFFYFAVLAAATNAYEDLQAIEGRTSYQDRIDLYRNVVRAGVFPISSTCIRRAGTKRARPVSAFLCLVRKTRPTARVAPGTCLISGRRVSSMV